MTASCPPSRQTKTCKAQHTPHESRPLLDATIEACFCWWAPWTCVQSTDSHYSSNRTLPASKDWKNLGFGPGIADRNLKASYTAAKADVKWTSPCPWGYLTLPEPLDLAALLSFQLFFFSLGSRRSRRPSPRSLLPDTLKRVGLGRVSKRNSTLRWPADAPCADRWGSQRKPNASWWAPRRKVCEVWSAHVFFSIAPMPWDDRFPETPACVQDLQWIQTQDSGIILLHLAWSSLR